MQANTGQVSHIMRISFGSFDTPEKVRKAIDFCKKAGIGGVQMVPIAPPREPAFLSRPQIVDRCKQLKTVFGELEAAGIEAHICVVRTFYPTSVQDIEDRNIGFSQPRMDHTGNTQQYTPCPLDETFQDYTRFAYGEMAETGTRSLLVDDDFRYQRLSGLGTTCFCPLHLAAFKERYGHDFSREELVDRLSGTEPNDIKADWMKLKQELLVEFATMLRETVHEVAPTVRLGLMLTSFDISMLDGRNARELVDTFAGDLQPVCRPGQGTYTDNDRTQILSGVSMSVAQTATLSDDTEIQAEVDLYPHTSGFNKSIHYGLDFQIRANLVCGLPRINLWPFNANEHIVSADHPYADALERNNPKFNAVLSLMPARPVMRGLTVLYNEANGLYRDHSKHTGMYWSSLAVNLWRLGLPWTCEESDTVMITRDSFPISREELTTWLAEKNVMIDGGAMDIITREGMADLVGVSAGEMLQSRQCLFEKMLEHPLNQGVAGRQNRRGGGFMLEVNDDSFEHLSHMQEGENPSLVVREQAGRRLAVCAQPMPSSWSPFWLNGLKQVQMHNVLDWLSGHTLPARVVGAPDVCPVVMDEPDGSSRTVSLVNVSTARAEGCRLLIRLPHGEPTKAEHVGDDGKVRSVPEADMTWENDLLTVTVREQTALNPSAVGVFRFSS